MSVYILIVIYLILWINAAHVMQNVMINMVKLLIVQMKMLYAKMIYLLEIFCTVTAMTIMTFQIGVDYMMKKISIQ